MVEIQKSKLNFFIKVNVLNTNLKELLFDIL